MSKAESLEEPVIQPSHDRALLPVCPTWSRNVSGRSFSKYLTAARKPPRRSIFFLPVIDPLSTLATVWGSISTLTDYTYTAFMVPLSLAFNDFDHANAFWYIDYMGAAIYVLDLLAQFHIGFIVRWDRSSLTITDGKLVAKNYIRHGSFYVDFIAVLPLIGQIVLSCIDHIAADAVRLILLLKLLRLVRVIALIGRMNKPGSSAGLVNQWMAMRMNAVTMFAVNTLFSLMVMVNLMACLWWWMAVTEGVENSWAANVSATKPGIDLETSDDWSRWLVSAYFALVTMATIGYGDIVPISLQEIGLVIIFILGGVAYFGFILSTIDTLVDSSSQESDEADLARFQLMETWLKKFSFPKPLQQEIRRHVYLSSNTSGPTEQDEKFYDSLPLFLKVKVAEEMQRTALIALLGGTEVWQDLDEPTRDSIARAVAMLSDAQTYPPGVTLHSLNDKAKYLYFLDEGELALAAPGVTQVVSVYAPAVMGAGALFGQWSEACGTWSATVKTATRCLIWKIDAALLERHLMHTAPSIFMSIVGHYINWVEQVLEGLEEMEVSKGLYKVHVLRKRYEDKLNGAKFAQQEAAIAIKALEEVAAEAAKRRAEARAAQSSRTMSVRSEREDDTEADDLEKNILTMDQNMEHQLEKRQDSVSDLKASEAVMRAAMASGALRKEGDTTFVV